MADDELQDSTTTQDGATGDPGSPAPPDTPAEETAPPAKKAAAKRAPRKRAAAAPSPVADGGPEGGAPEPAAEPEESAPAKKAPAKRTARKTAAKKVAASEPTPPTTAEATSDPAEGGDSAEAGAVQATDVLFQVPRTTATRAPARRRTTTTVASAPAEPQPDGQPDAQPDDQPTDATASPTDTDAPTEAPAPKKKSGGKKGAKSGAKAKTEPTTEPTTEPGTEAVDDASEEPGDGSVKGGSGKSGSKKSGSKKSGTEKGSGKGAKKKAAPAATAADDESDDELDGTSVDNDDVAAEDEAAAATVEETADLDGAEDTTDAEATDETEDAEETDDDSDDAPGQGGRRRRRRGGRRRRRGSGGGAGSASGSAEGDDDGEQPSATGSAESDQAEQSDQSDQGDDEAGSEGSTRRRRRRRREGDSGGNGGNGDDPSNTVTRVRRGRSAEDEITAVSGSTRLEAKKQRRREGREAGRRRAPIVSEAEFLARRESVERVMAIRQRDDVTQIGVLEDKVLVEHYVARESQTSMIGNVYLGRVQNVLPSMEAAFIDVGRGRNAVLYAGEVNWKALGHKEGSPRKIESVLSSGQTILVQVTKDPIGHKGARLTSQVSLPGRYLVYVPDGTTSGISRKLPDTERHRLKTLLKQIVPDTAGVIVRTAAEGASEDELTADVERLKARWEDIEAKIGRGNAPQLLYGEPDLTLKVVRDLFTEDFASLVVQGDDAWQTVSEYVAQLAPDLADRLVRYDPAEHHDHDLFTTHRVDEQIAKALDRKVYLPSGGSLVIDRTEAMTVVDVNTGKFTGSGGNLEETVTKNNLEAAEEVVRQLRLRDIGGIIVVDFIDMVLESNRDLVLRRLVECLGRDRTRHQVAEVTSLGLVQMTRKRIGTGLLEAFSESCDHCAGRGVVTHDMPVEARGGSDDDGRRGGGNGGGGRRRGGRSRGGEGGDQAPRRDHDTQSGDTDGQGKAPRRPTPAEFAAMAKHAEAAAQAADATAADEADRASRSDAADQASQTDQADQADQAAAAPEAVEVPTSEPGQPAEPVQPTEPAQPRVSTRTRRGASRGTPTTAGTAEPAVAQPSSPAEPQTEAPTQADARPDSASTGEDAPPEPQEQAASSSATPAGPRLVTRTRRGASRPAESAGAAVPTSATTPVAGAGTEDGATTTTAPAATAPTAPTTPPAPPKVVTRTRGRSATRVAGPPTDETPSASPATSGVVGGPPADGVVEPIDVGLDTGDANGQPDGQPDVQSED